MNPSPLHHHSTEGRTEKNYHAWTNGTERQDTFEITHETVEEYAVQ